MNTLDTEWEKEFDGWANNVIEHESERKWIKNFIIRTCVAEWNKGFEKGRSEYLDKAKDIDEALSSRDTYWKERVDRAFVILDTNIQELVTYEEGRVSKESVLTCVRRIKRELDNLK